MQTDLVTLRERILETAKRAPVWSQVEDIVLESDRYDEGTDFLRVIVQMKQCFESDDTEFEALIEAIESTVGELDERYPSVRFSDVV